MASRPKATSHETELALFKQDLRNLSQQLTSIQQALETKYAQAADIAALRLEIAALRLQMVTQDQYWPVKVTVFGMIGLVLTTTVVALLTLVITKGA